MSWRSENFPQGRPRSARSPTSRVARVGVALSAALAIAFAAGGDARAAPFHDWWLEPARTSAQVGDTIDVTAFVGVAFRGERVKRNPKAIVRFDAADALGVAEVGGEPGGDPVGRFTARVEGTTVLAWQSRPAPLYLRAPEFEAYLKEEGLERIVELRAQRGESQKMGLERYSRCAKALVQVGPAARPRDRALGLPLELVLAPPGEGEPASVAAFSLAFRGEPLAGALVMALERDHPAEILKARTDAEGKVRFELPRPGFWLVKSVHMVESPNEPGASRLDWESYWASSTLARAP